MVLPQKLSKIIKGWVGQRDQPLLFFFFARETSLFMKEVYDSMYIVGVLGVAFSVLGALLTGIVKLVKTIGKKD